MSLVRKISVLLATVAMSAVAMLLFFVGAAPVSAYAEGAAFVLPSGSRPQAADRMTEEDRAIIDGGIGASGEALQNALLRFYKVANESRFEKIDSLMLQESVMGLNPNAKKDFGVQDCASGDVLMHGFTLTTPETFYNQFAAEAHAGNAFGTIMGAFSMMAKLNYKTKDGKYFFVSMQTPRLECDTGITTFPYATYNLLDEPKEYSYEDFLEATYTLDAPGEIFNLDYCSPLLFNAEKSSITHENGVYKAHFEVDMSIDSAILQNWYRLPQTDIQANGMNSSIEKYFHFYCDMEMWDNGYIKTYFSDYARSAGLATSATTDRYNFIYDGEEIRAILATDPKFEGMSEREISLVLQDLNNFNEMYITREIVVPGLSDFELKLVIAGSCVGGALLILVIVLIVLNVLRKQGKFPKWQARIDARRERKNNRKENGKK